MEPLVIEHPDPAIRIVELGPQDRHRVAAIAGQAFEGNLFYQRILGVNTRQFERYWDAFFRLSLRASRAKVMGIERNGTLMAAIALAWDHFPGPLESIRFLMELLFRIGPVPLIRYLRFAWAWDRVMARPRSERSIEVCGLWLFARKGSAGLGADLVRHAVAAVGEQGYRLVTGFIDVSNRPLVRLYQRIGFTISPPFTFLGLDAATIEIWSGSEREVSHAASAAV